MDPESIHNSQPKEVGQGKLPVGPVLVVASVIALVVILARLADVEVGVSTEEISRGISSTDRTLIAQYKEALSSAKVPFRVEIDKTGRETLLWDVEYSDKAREVEDKILGIPPAGYSSLCFESSASGGELVARLESSTIEHSVIELSDERRCVYWPEHADNTVQNIYPRLREIRKAAESTPTNSE